MTKIPLPTFQYEQMHWDRGVQFIAGVDEVGRGAFAGPVVAAAVVFLSNVFAKVKPTIKSYLEQVNDSKLLTSKKRKELSEIILQHAHTYAVAEVSVEVINRIGVGKATQVAFTKAISDLRVPPEHILMDAFYIDSIDKSVQTPIIKGDQKSISIAAASIIAKVYRDELMIKLSKEYPDYFFAKNKGYGTKVHREMISKLGLCTHHRRSFNLSKFLGNLSS